MIQGVEELGVFTQKLGVQGCRALIFRGGLGGFCFLSRDLHKKLVCDCRLHKGLKLCFWSPPIANT